MRRWIVALAGLGAGIFAGCLLELDDGKSCGDGTHDPEFEECDPADPGSLEGRCEAGEVASCDEISCTLRCGACGDGVLDPGEHCDGNSAVTLPACQEWTCVDCSVVCPRCGNGEINAGEECDFELAISLMPATCEDISVPGRPGDTYEAGGNPSCRSDCRWDRTTCNLCGNGELDDQIVDPNTGGPINAAERCDGELFDLSDRFDRCLSVCGEDGRDCKATCGEGCFEIHVDPNDSGCCVRPGYARAAGVPCCCELPEGEVPEYCTGVFDPPEGGGGGTTAPACPG